MISSIRRSGAADRAIARPWRYGICLPVSEVFPRRQQKQEEVPHVQATLSVHCFPGPEQSWFAVRDRRASRGLGPLGLWLCGWTILWGRLGMGLSVREFLLPIPVMGLLGHPLRRLLPN